MKKTSHVSFHVALKVILKNKKGETLLLLNPDHTQMAGYYDFPGGRIEESEIRTSFKEIIKREIKEEIGTDVEYSPKDDPVAISRHFYFTDAPKNTKRQYIFWVFFEADYLGGKIKISEEHKGYRWVKLSKNNLEEYFIRGPLEGIRNYFF